MIARLFAMMALQFFIWGAWLPLIFGYLPSLGFSPIEQSLILSAFPVASIVGMFFSNQWADRSASPERVLALSHLIGGLAILGCGFTRSFWPFFLLMLVHCLLYVPTISITNSIAFANLQNAGRQYGLVRMGGTVGWILAAWPFTFIFVNWAAVDAAQPQGFINWLGTALGNPLTGDAAKAAASSTFVVAGIASLVLAAFSLTLPRSEKSAPAAGRTAWAEAFALLRHPFFLVLWLVTLVDSFVHNAYFNWTGVFLGTPQDAGGVGIAANWIAPVMSIGQVAEIVTMVVLGTTLKKLGWRTTMVVGILGHAARFAVYALSPQSPGMIIAVQVLHGICYAFFFATVYIFVDAYSPKNIRASAQGLFNLQILGIGVLLANMLCPWLLQSVYTTSGVTDFRHLFLLPMAAAAIAAIGLALFFRPPHPRPAAEA
jgi:MFS family permease